MSLVSTSRRIFKMLSPFLFSALAPVLWPSGTLTAQSQQLPYMNAGPNSVFAQIDFSRAISDQEVWTGTEKNQQSSLIDSGVVSALDLQAPDKAVKEFKRGTAALKAQNAKDAIFYFEQAVKLYPDFVSAHNALGLAYLDRQDARARLEFETAAKLDDRLPEPYLNLGLLAIATGDFAAADINLQKAADLAVKDPLILSALAFAENGNHRYAESIATVNQVHALEHRGFANVHYIAAAAAMAMGNLTLVRSQLQTFLTEDSSNPLAPVARQNLQKLEDSRLSDQQGAGRSIEEAPTANRVHRVTFPNSEYLQAQLTGLMNSPDPDDCGSCDSSSDRNALGSEETKAANTAPSYTSWNHLFTIHQAVDETAMFFSVTHRGHAVNDLLLSDIQLRDNNKLPDRILQFVPQSRLPLRLGLLIDTSESVKNRVSFEKKAAERFLEKVLTNDTDLAFVEGFDNQRSVTQDFTRDLGKLELGIEKLNSSGDGTAIFDAIFVACWKLSAYPDLGRTAKVLVVLTDGEDNSSHRSLAQVIEEAEAAGVTVYTLSTAEKLDEQTDASRILKVLAERTGGESMFPSSLRALDFQLNQLPQAIRSRYLIAYKAADFRPDGRFRPVHVTAEKDGKRLHVQVRKGYYARAAVPAH